MPLLPYSGRMPSVGERVFLAPGAFVSGDVTLGDDVSFWFGAVARGDVHWIRIGPRTNIQDGAILHVSYQTHPLTIGADVVVGHGAILHGCTVEDGALIGIGAQVLDGAVIEAGAQVGAGALVAPGKRVRAGQLVLGVPARETRALSDEEAENIARTSARYVRLKDEYRQVLGDGLGQTSEEPSR